MITVHTTFLRILIVLITSVALISCNSSGGGSGTPESEPTDISSYTLSYSSADTFALGDPISLSPTLSPTLSDTATVTYSIAPELPDGLMLESETGIISGTITLSSTDTYTVTATGTGDYSGTAEATLTLQDFIKTDISNYTFGYSSAGTFDRISLSPTWSDTPTVTYSINPELPDGLMLESETGIISGTITFASYLTLTDGSSYTVTATGTGDYSDTAEAALMLQNFISPLPQEVTTSVDGTAISTLDELKAMSADLTGTYHLTANIDLSGETNWTPIGDNTTSFTGTLHGNGYIIHGLTIDSPNADYQGLFGDLNDANINDLVIGVKSIKANTHVGALVGYVKNTATRSGLINIAGVAMDTPAEGAETITGSGNFIGGLVGTLGGDSDLIGNSIGISVSGTNTVGGLVGGNSGNLTGYATGAVTGNISVGGLSGANTDRVTGYATGAVTGNDNVGGLSGANYGSLNGYATGAVTGTSQVGGLVGKNGSFTINSGIVSGYATGAVTGTNHVGGLVGQNGEGNTSKVSGYATGKVTGTGSDVGGLVGSNFVATASGYYSATASGYWDKTSTAQDNSAAGTAGISKTANIALSGATYTDDDTDGAGTIETIFNEDDFMAIFDLANGAAQTWPKLKASYTFNNGFGYTFSLTQPTVSDTDGDGTIEISW